MRAEREDSYPPHCAKTGPTTLYRCVTALQFEMYLISAAEGQNARTVAHRRLRRKCALFPLMDNRSCDRRVALKSSRGCGVMKMSD